MMVLSLLYRIFALMKRKIYAAILPGHPDLVLRKKDEINE
jgi:hypothetical protein